MKEWLIPPVKSSSTLSESLFSFADHLAINASQTWSFASSDTFRPRLRVERERIQEVSGWSVLRDWTTQKREATIRVP
jgi:hypothetical protein